MNKEKILEILKQNKKNLLIVLFVLLVLISVIKIVSRDIPISSEEKILISKIKKDPSTLNYSELSNLRLKYAREALHNWELSKDKKELEKATIYTSSAIDVNPKNAEAYRLFAGIMLKAPTNKDALKYAQDSLLKAIEYDKADVVSRTELARVYMLQGKYYEASDIYESLFNISKSSVIATNTTKLAECYIADKRVKWGIIYFNKLVRKNPSNKGVLIPLAVLYKNDKQIQKAKSVLYKLKASNKATKTEKTYASYLLKIWKGV